MARLLALFAATSAMQPASRRAALQSLSGAVVATLPQRAAADVFAGCPVVPRALVVNTEDVAATAAFLREAIGMEIYTLNGATLAAFGPTGTITPKDFVPGVSSLDVDAGHFSLELRAATGVAPPDVERDRVLYVQLALPNQFRASRAAREPNVARATTWTVRRDESWRTTGTVRETKLRRHRGVLRGQSAEPVRSRPPRAGLASCATAASCGTATARGASARPAACRCAF